MTTRFSKPTMLKGALLAFLFIFTGCGATDTVTAVATIPPTSPATATATLVPTVAPTLTPAPGVCNATDFPTKTTGGPYTSFQYPPLTYYFHITDAAGTYYYVMCSSGDPTSILAFLESSLPAGGWKVTTSAATTLTAVQSNNPQEGMCAWVNVTVGAHAGYAGEWDATFHSPTMTC